MILIEAKKTNLSKRYIANVIDYVILLLMVGLAIFILGEPAGEGAYRVTGIKALVIPLLWFLYFPFCETVIDQTIGKKAFDLHVVDFKGNQPTIGQSFLRRMLDPIEIICLGIPSLLSINHSAKHQRVGDMIAETLVVSSNAACRFCGMEVELNTREVINAVFKCPHCNNINN